MERFCQHGDQFPIGSAVNWRSGKAHAQRSVVFTGDLTSRGAGHHVNLKRHAAILLGIFDHLGNRARRVNQLQEKNMMGQPRKSVPATAACNSQMTTNATIGEMSNAPTGGT